MATEKKIAVVVQCIVETGRFRAGRKWEHGETTAEVTADELAALKRDAGFVVREAAPEKASEKKS